MSSPENPSVRTDSSCNVISGQSKQLGRNCFIISVRALALGSPNIIFRSNRRKKAGSSSLCKKKLILQRRLCMNRVFYHGKLVLANKKTLGLSSSPSICVRNSFLNRLDASWSKAASRFDEMPSTSSMKITEGA